MKTCRECMKTKGCKIKGYEGDWCQGWTAVVVLPDEWGFIDREKETVHQNNTLALFGG
jgi:hypothetical protein